MGVWIWALLQNAIFSGCCAEHQAVKTLCVLFPYPVTEVRNVLLSYGFVLVTASDGGGLRVLVLPLPGQLIVSPLMSRL
jgi:hypothetical protein